VQYLRPLPVLAARSTVASKGTAPGTPPALPWPKQGSAAVAVPELGELGTGGVTKQLPIASVAKVMVALVVVDDHPLQPKQDGPTIAITDADVQEYNAERAQEQSVLEVRSGETLTEYQALQGLLIPSGNNVAALLAKWDAGSVPAMVDKLNQRAAALKMTQTHFDDVSGFSPRTISVPSDLIVMGQAAMEHAVLADIVSQADANLPVAGRVFNVNYALGQSGIVGIKTGSSPEAGGCLLFLAGGGAAQVFGAVLGQGSLDDAFKASKDLITAVTGALRVTEVAGRGATVGRYRVPWSGEVDVTVARPIRLVSWPGTAYRTRLVTRKLKPPVAAGTEVGYLEATEGMQQLRVPVATSDPILNPGNRWRLTRTDPLTS
jgi:D-alanyl-D-alanine carboxypeptidase (penicillin-binding protein 5/6)